MRLRFVAAAVTLMLPLADLGAQTILRTVTAAEAEGAVSRHGVATAVQPTVAAAAFSGTSARRCVSPPSEDSLVAGSLRSGDLIARARFTGRWGIRSGKGLKVLWLPLHAVTDAEQPLLIRAARVGSPSDSVRETIARAVHSHGADGYPSILTFPHSGEWLVVATTGPDWGCFLVTVGT
jgi:hypothetical protein